MIEAGKTLHEISCYRQVALTGKKAVFEDHSSVLRIVEYGYTRNIISTAKRAYSVLSGSLITTAWRALCHCRWRRQPVDMNGNYE